MHTLKERVIHPFRRPGFERLDALRDVSFDVASGEFFGIVGRNGSGKSTLLKCLAGIYRAEGEILLRGRMAPFIELGVGFNPDMTARENVVINAVMLGLTPAEARARYDAIIDFAELQEFTELKLKNYSSGMQVRLAFSVMVQVDADLLLIDEVLAVGDSAFQRKCHDSLMAARAEGRTILLVTHDMNAVQRFCDRAMLLDHGDLISVGDPREVARRYEEVNMARYGRGLGPVAHGGDGTAAILECWVEDETGEPAEELRHGRPARVRMEVALRTDSDHPYFGFVVTDEQGRAVLAIVSTAAPPESDHFAAGEVVLVDIAFDCVLAAGNYSVSPEVRHSGAERRLMDHRENAASFQVVGVHVSGGMVDLPRTISFSRVEAVERTGS